MFNKISYIIKTSLIGCVTVILPVAMLFFIFNWLFKLVTNIIQPFTNFLIKKSDLKEILADIIVLCIILMLCFFVGIVVKTKIGKFIHKSLENHLLKFAPGYNMIKEIVMQFLGRSKAPFSSVALVQLFENSILATAFITDTHENGSYTVFVPTGPNPTSGFIYHMSGKFVHLIDVPIEKAMRSIISCGAGSDTILSYYHKEKNNKP